MAMEAGIKLEWIREGLHPATPGPKIAPRTPSVIGSASAPAMT
jgi:hypothetical protein